MEILEQNTNILIDKFKSVFKTSNIIFSNRGKLENSYIPNEIFARDGKILEINSNLQPILDFSAPKSHERCNMISNILLFTFIGDYNESRSSGSNHQRKKCIKLEVRGIHLI